jgi:hypothetical protein
LQGFEYIQKIEKQIKGQWAESACGPAAQCRAACLSQVGCGLLPPDWQPTNTVARTCMRPTWLGALAAKCLRDARVLAAMTQPAVALGITVARAQRR